MVDFFEGVGDEKFEVNNITDHSVSVYKLKFWQLCTLISTYVMFALATYSGQLMIIWYITQYAPKNRPINRMILVDQVFLFLISMLSSSPQMKMPLLFYLQHCFNLHFHIL